MSQSFIIEIGDAAVGIVLRASRQGRFHFIASDQRVRALDGRSFQRPAQAENAARAILAALPIRNAEARVVGAGEPTPPNPAKSPFPAEGKSRLMTAVAPLAAARRRTAARGRFIDFGGTP